MTPTDQPSETESVPIGSKSVDQPICGKCGNPMSPEDSTMHPELFMHDACLPTELLLRDAQAEAPVCPCCHKADRVVKSNHPEHGEFFCPCNEPGPQYFDYDGSGTLLTTNKDGKPIAVHVDFEGGMHFRYGGPAEAPVAGVEQRIAQVMRETGLSRAHVEACFEEIERTPQAYSELQVVLDNTVESARQEIAAAYARVAELEAERDAYEQGCESAKRGASEWHSKWLLNETEKINLRGERNQLTADLSTARAEVEALREERDRLATGICAIWPVFSRLSGGSSVRPTKGSVESAITLLQDLLEQTVASRDEGLKVEDRLRAELQSAKDALVKTERGLMDVLPIGEHTLESIPSVIKQLVDACAELRRDSETWRHVLEMVRANGFESVGQVLVKLDSLQKERAIILRLDQPWPLVSILQELIHAAAILLEEKDYDGHGWEGIDAARGLADSLRQELEKMRGEGLE